MNTDDLALLENLGVEGVFTELGKGRGKLGRPGSPMREEIIHWLSAKMEERQAALSSSVNHSRSYNANKLTVAATILSTITVLTVVVIQFV
ncbi:MAG: hypothetical protein OEW63_01730 [Gammaproteobacteria bacterium]|nr:hypothetical protein [Gammaproteobacteria bacterium]